MGKTTVIYVKFLHDIAFQKLIKFANVSRSYSKATKVARVRDTV